ncbi:unnamed protein product, partial [Laminaria digitata]
MEVNNDTAPSTAHGHPVRPGVISRSSIERLKDEEIDQDDLLESKQHLSPGRAARMALQAITRKLGRADLANNSAETTSSLTVERRVRAHSRDSGGVGGRREEQQRHRAWDGKGAIDRPRRTSSPTGTSAGSRTTDPPAPSPPASQEEAGAVRPSRKSHGDARAVQPSAPPRGVGGPSPRAQAVRRRTTARASNVSGLSIQPHHRSGGGGRATATASTTTSANRHRHHANQGMLEIQHRQRAQQRVAPSTEPIADADGSPDFNTAARKSIRGRSASARYLLLSVVLIALGLILRYFWRHLAGLAGAMLILAAARRWTGVTGSASRAALAPPLQDSERVAGKRKGR